MSIFIEKETDEAIDFPYESVLCAVAEKALEQEGCSYEAEISITLTDAGRIRELNKESRGIDKVTDVLSFPMLEFAVPGDFSFITEEDFSQFNPDTGELLLGDIVICVPQAKKQALEFGHALKREIAFLTAHSMLHLCGYDHVEEEERKLMEQRQEEIMQALGIGR